MSKATKYITAIIITLSVLLLITSMALACVVIFGGQNKNTDRDVVTDNVITPEKKSISSVGYMKYPMLAAWFVSPIFEADETLELYRNHPDDNTPFDVKNMFPGDEISKTYCVKVSYTGTMTVHFVADIRDGYEKLAEVLECSVSLRRGSSEESELLYSGLMRDMPESVDVTVSNRGRVTEKLFYDITVSLDTSVGNDYQNKMLIADFIWWADCEPGRPVGPIVPIVTTTGTDTPEVSTDVDTSDPDVTTDPDSTETELTSKPDDTDDVTDTESALTTESDTVPAETTTSSDTETSTAVTSEKETTAPDVTTEGPETGTQSGQLISPATGNSMLIIFVMLLSFIFAILIILVKRRKEDEKHEQ